MANLRKFNDPALSAVCDPVAPGEDVRNLIVDMMAVLRSVKNGVGLAAPQVGALKRVCIIWHQRHGGERIVMVNPFVAQSKGPTTNLTEGCLSYPGVNVPVSRHSAVDVTWTDPQTGNRHGRWFSGFQAIVTQHEIDHLDGICRVGEAWRRNRDSGFDRQTPSTTPAHPSAPRRSDSENAGGSPNDDLTAPVKFEKIENSASNLSKTNDNASNDLCAKQGGTQAGVDSGFACAPARRREGR